ncbi:MAG: methylmalonyl-CoA mutase family protein [Chitinophagaceae bacterium]
MYLAKDLSFFFNAHNNLFEEVAKFRAAQKNVGYHNERT